jgi:hypothetical protein
VAGHMIQVKYFLDRNRLIDFSILFKACLQDRRGVKYNVSFDLSASCIENFLLHSSNISRTMKLGRIDSVPSNGMSSSIDDDDDESSTISFHVSTKYTYTLTFSSTITASRGKDFVFRISVDVKF